MVINAKSKNIDAMLAFTSDTDPDAYACLMGNEGDIWYVKTVSLT